MQFIDSRINVCARLLLENLAFVGGDIGYLPHANPSGKRWTWKTITSVPWVMHGWGVPFQENNLYSLKERDERKSCSAKLFYFTLWGTTHIYYFVVVMFLLKNRRSLAPSAPDGKKKCYLDVIMINHLNYKRQITLSIWEVVTRPGPWRFSTDEPLYQEC